MCIRDSLIPLFRTAESESHIFLTTGYTNRMESLSLIHIYPHVSEHIVVAHNGIVENHEPLREELKARGYTLVSETDTEVIAHLVNWELKQDGTCLLYTSRCV